MGKLKKLRKCSEKLSHRVQILEQKQRIAELRSETGLHALGFHKREKHNTGLRPTSEQLEALIKQVKKHNGLTDEEETNP